MQFKRVWIGLAVLFVAGFVALFVLAGLPPDTGKNAARVDWLPAYATT